MEAEFFRAFCLQDLIGFQDLVRCHAVFCVSRIVHNIIADLKEPARVETAADRLRNVADGFLQEFDMGNIIQVDDRPQLVRIPEIFRRCVIG